MASSSQQMQPPPPPPSSHSTWFESTKATTYPEAIVSNPRCRVGSRGTIHPTDPTFSTWIPCRNVGASGERIRKGWWTWFVLKDLGIAVIATQKVIENINNVWIMMMMLKVKLLELPTKTNPCLSKKIHEQTIEHNVPPFFQTVTIVVLVVLAVIVLSFSYWKKWY